MCTPTSPSRSLLQGATTVKEELLDDIIKESGPYQPPGMVVGVLWCMLHGVCTLGSLLSVDKIRMRAEMSSTTEHDAQPTIEPNE